MRRATGRLTPSFRTAYSEVLRSNQSLYLIPITAFAYWTYTSSFFSHCCKYTKPAALEGNDVITGKGDNDLFLGNPGDDVISGGKGNDNLCAYTGANRISGGMGMVAYSIIAVTRLHHSLIPDGSKDIVDCGLGNDEAWINVSVDHDTASGSRNRSQRIVMM